MACNLDAPNLKGRDEEERIKNLETWAVKITNNLNYFLNHLDKTNFVASEAPINNEDLIAAMDAQYKELRTYIIKMLGGDT